jgi:DNA-binding CsgD family transcriptional regulator
MIADTRATAQAPRGRQRFDASELAFDASFGEPGSVSSAYGLVGREAELARATAAVREVSGGQAAVLVIEGEAGIGKTRLVERIVEDARHRDLLVCSGHAHPFERARPFGVVAAALELKARSSDPQRAAIGALLAGGAAGQPVGDGGQYQVVEDVVDLVETACAARPVVFVAEDLHWADSASLLAISSMARQLPLSPLLVVVTTRPSPLSAEVVRCIDDLVTAGASTLRLGPLPPRDVAALAGIALGASPGPALTALLDKAGGNPLWVVAMLDALDDEGLLQPAGDTVEATTAELPATLHALVVRRLRDLPTATLELLQIAAVLGDAVSLRDVAFVARRPPAEVVRQLNEAFAAQLLDEADDHVQFRHQLVHDAIYQQIPAPVRVVLHREAAEALTAAGANRLDVADHLMLGAERGDEHAVVTLRDAAREASARAPLVAVELVRRAEALLPAGHPDADLVSLEVVQALLRAGKVSEASARAEAVLARTHDAAVDTPLRVALVGALALENRADEVVAVVQRSLAGSDLLPSDEVPMLAQQSWALTYSGEHRAGEAAAGRALAVAERAGNAAMTVLALTALSVAVGRGGRYHEALAHATRAAEIAAASDDTRSMPLQPKLFVGLASFDCDLVDEARAAYRAALDDEFGSGWWLSDTLVADAQALFVIGEWDDAMPRLIASGRAAQEKDHALLASQSLAYRAIIATATGDLQTAKEFVTEVAGSVEGERLSYNAGAVAFAIAQLKLAENDRQGAYDVLLRCWRFEAATETRYYHRCLAPDLVRLALRLGHRDVAVEVADTVAAGARLAPEVPTVQSVARRARGLVDDDVEAMLDAVALARRAPHLVEHTGACEDAATRLAAAGQLDDAAAMLREALERHERAGAQAWAGRTRAALRKLGVRPGQRGSRSRPTRGWESLTATERTVSLLVAEGLTNGAVARRLYISPHTVNTHLRHVFAKLGVSNRVALTREVHRTIE